MSSRVAGAETTSTSGILWTGLKKCKPATRSVEPDGRTRFFGHAEVGAAMASMSGAAIGRAASGVVYGYFDRASEAAAWMSKTAAGGVLVSNVKERSA